jgi:hypothetical protein
MPGDDSSSHFFSAAQSRTGDGVPDTRINGDPAQDGQGRQVGEQGDAIAANAAPGAGVARGHGSARRQKALPYIVAVLLFGFGAYESALYFGHKVVPNSDAPSFMRVGRELLSLQMPSSFKRAPVVGLLAVGLSHGVGGPHPELTAGWLLNALLHPFTVVLLWLMARRLIGRWAWCLALVTAINPWWLLNLREPVAETTLHFFIAATFYAIFTRSRWRYVLASVAAVVRYDAAALFLVIFLLDMVQSRTARQRIRAVLFSTAAVLPLALWLLGMALHFRGAGATSYLNEMGTNAPFGEALRSFLATLWMVVVSPLFRTPAGLSGTAAVAFSICIGVPLGVGFGLGVLRAGAERCWEVLGLLTFLLAYLVVHALHSFVMPRYCSTLLWIVLLVAVYGLHSGWLILRARISPSARSLLVLQGAGVLLAGLWAVNAAGSLSDMAAYSARSVSVPYVAVTLACLLLAAEWLRAEQRQPLRDVLVLASLCLVILSNQYQLVRVMGNGRQDIEFKLLADWYRHHAGPRDKLATTYADVVGLYLPQRGANLIPMAQLKADDGAGFLRNCRRQGITYLAWDSRLGCHPEDRYYQLYGLANLAPLAAPESLGPFEFVIQFQVSRERWINVFRWRSPRSDSLILSGSGSDLDPVAPAVAGRSEGASPEESPDER